LSTTIEEIKEYNVNIVHAIMDAGYYSEKNIRELYDNHIPFLIRLTPNRVLYKNLVKDHAKDLQSSHYSVLYRDRVVNIKRERISLFGHRGYAYVAIDIQRRNEEQLKYLKSAIADGISPTEMDEQQLTQGMFVLISAKKIEVEDVLPLYYTRQAVEQVFDYAKNDVELLPIRVHGEETLRGHLFLSFMASIAYIAINKKLAETKFSAKAAFHSSRGLKCAIYDNHVIPSIPNKVTNTIASKLKIEIPQSINLKKDNYGDKNH
jgi:transposase